MNHVPGTGFMLWWEIIVNSPNEHLVSRCLESQRFCSCTLKPFKETDTFVGTKNIVLLFEYNYEI